MVAILSRGRWAQVHSKRSSFITPGPIWLHILPMFFGICFRHFFNIDFCFCNCIFCANANNHDDVIKWKHFPPYWPFVCGIHWSPVNSHHKIQWCGALKFSLISVWRNGWVNNRDAGDVRCHRTHYEVTIMTPLQLRQCLFNCISWQFIIIVSWNVLLLFGSISVVKSLYNRIVFLLYTNC